MDCFNCEDENCAMKREPYKGMYPCMRCAHIHTKKLNEYCIMCIKGACCFREENADD